MTTLITMAPGGGTCGTSMGLERVPPSSTEPERVQSVVAKQLTGYILSSEEMKAFLKELFPNHENYDFDVKVCC